MRITGTTFNAAAYANAHVVACGNELNAIAAGLLKVRVKGRTQVLLGGILAGIPGMIFAMPVASVIKYLVPQIYRCWR